MKGLFFLSFLLSSFAGLCQTSITGKVVSETGSPLPKASVFISNSTTGVYTNDKGEFTLINLPSGSFNFAVSYVGYEVVTVAVPAALRNKVYLVKMQPLNNELQAVIIRNYDKRGWKKWGDVFTAAFIGTSSYASNCTIANKDDIRFIFSEQNNQLKAYADKPLLIINQDLGYQMEVNLVDFSYDITNRIVDYQTFCFFKEMQGSDAETTAWKKNRLKVYALSLLRFMRSLYLKNFSTEGYEIRLIERKINTEKQRVQNMYGIAFNRISDSLKRSNARAADINSLVERSFSKDSLNYYKKVLAQAGETEKISKTPARFSNIAKEKDSVTVLLDGKDYMQVVYTRSKEPEEYTTYKSEKMQQSGLTDVFTKPATRDKPVTELNLLQGIPVEIHQNGSFTNVDLYLNGFWGWWEKMATKLPFEYEPPE